jgi:hypothetical protein
MGNCRIRSARHSYEAVYLPCESAWGSSHAMVRIHALTFGGALALLQFLETVRPVRFAPAPGRVRRMI